VYAWGNNDYGQLGVDDENSRFSPERVVLRNSETQPLPFIVMVSAGVDGTLYLTDQGRVLGAGNNSENQLGLNKAGGFCGPIRAKAVEEQRARGTVEEGTIPGTINAAMRPTQLYTLRPFPTPFASVVCGETHSATIDIAGRLYLFGSNAHGQLGTGNFKRCYGAHKVAGDLATAKVMVVGIGKDYTTAALQGGAVFSWGKAEFGLLGVELAGTACKASIPRQLENDFHNVHQMRCTETSTIVISERVTRTGRLQQYDVQTSELSTPPLAAESIDPTILAADTPAVIASSVGSDTVDVSSPTSGRIDDDDLDSMPWLERELEESEYISAPDALLAAHVGHDETDSEDEKEMANSPWLLQELQCAEYIPMNSHLRTSADLSATKAAASRAVADEDADELQESPWLAQELAEGDVIPIVDDTDPGSDEESELAMMPWLREELVNAEYIPSNATIRQGRVGGHIAAAVINIRAAGAVVGLSIDEEDEGVRSLASGTTPCIGSEVTGWNAAAPNKSSRPTANDPVCQLPATAGGVRITPAIANHDDEPAAMPCGGKLSSSEPQDHEATTAPELENLAPRSLTNVSECINANATVARSQKAKIGGTASAGANHTESQFETSTTSVQSDHQRSSCVEAFSRAPSADRLPFDAGVLVTEVAALAQASRKQAVAMQEQMERLSQLYKMAEDQQTMLGNLQSRLSTLESERVLLLDATSCQSHSGPSAKLIEVRGGSHPSFQIDRHLNPTDPEENFPFIATVDYEGAAAGLVRGQIVLAINGVSCIDRQFPDVEAQIAESDQVSLEVMPRTNAVVVVSEDDTFPSTVPTQDKIRTVTVKRNGRGSLGFAIAGPVLLQHEIDHDQHFVSLIEAHAEEAGLCVGDRVLSVHGRRCSGKLLNEVVDLLQHGGDTVELHVVRDHAGMHAVASKHENTDDEVTHSLHFKVAWPESNQVEPDLADAGDKTPPVREITLKRDARCNFGLKVNATPESADPDDDYPSVSNVAVGARAAGLVEDDLVLEINGVPTLNRPLAAIYHQLVKDRGNIRLIVRSGSQLPDPTKAPTLGTQAAALVSPGTRRPSAALH
jgi:hypothetical protein